MSIPGTPGGPGYIPPPNPSFPPNNPGFHFHSRADLLKGSSKGSSTGPLKEVSKESSWWPSWLTWSKKPVEYMKSTDAMRNPALQNNFTWFLDHTEPPNAFRATQVAHKMTFEELQTMGYGGWEDVMPAVIELAFEMRAAGYCQIFKGMKVLGEDVLAIEVIDEDIVIMRART